ncbi:hypothetical protein CDD83_2274 [Cordyceps sp. RAO-2017]|nr:hypothetical protein CDD83_2274 [Cordyceps sp. RAO-2017]
MRRAPALRPSPSSSHLSAPATANRLRAPGTIVRRAARAAVRADGLARPTARAIFPCLSGKLVVVGRVFFLAWTEPSPPAPPLLSLSIPRDRFRLARLPRRGDRPFPTRRLSAARNSVPCSVFVLSPVKVRADGPGPAKSWDPVIRRPSSGPQSATGQVGEQPGS